MYNMPIEFVAFIPLWDLFVSGWLVYTIYYVHVLYSGIGLYITNSQLNDKWV